MRPVRAIFFDFNGTLSLDEHLLCAVYRQLFAEQGAQLSEEEYFEQLAGRSDEDVVREWLGVDGGALDEVIQERIDRYVALAADGTTIPERIRDAVRYAAIDVPLAVVTGAFRVEVEAVLAAAGLASCFSSVVTAEDVERGKPSPEGYLLALERIGDGMQPHEAVAFEDTEAGVASARAAGLRCLAVAGTQQPGRLRAADELVEAIDAALMRRLLG